MTTNHHPARGAGDPLREQQSALADELVTRQFAAQPHLAQRYGPAGREKCLQDANYHLSYLSEAMTAGAPGLFTNYIAWAKVMLAKRGIPASDLASHLELIRTVVGASLPGEAGILAVQYLDAALDQMRSTPEDLPTCLVEGAPHGRLAGAYLSALLGGERHVASRLVLDAVSSGIAVKEIYLHVFEPAQHEVGRLWQLNDISVAQEHYCTAATQLIMSQLYPYVFASEKGAGTMVATCVAGDLHEIGLRMVADFLEMDGWNTFYLGASMPAAAVVDTVVLRRAQVLCISATMSFHLRAVSELIRRVRAHPECQDVKILVGGYPFVVAPQLWRTLGADGCAADAQLAAALIRRLIA